MRPRDNNDRTNQRPWLLVGPVVVVALAVLAWAVPRAGWTGQHLLTAALLTAGVVGAFRLRFQMRFRAAQVEITVISTVILIATAFLPSPWIVIVAGTGMALAVGQVFVSQRSWSSIKFGFNVGKEALSAAAAATAATLVGLHPLDEHGLGRMVITAFLSLGGAIVAYAIVDELLSQCLFAILSRTPLHQLLAAHWDTILISRLGSLAIAIVAVCAYRINPWLISVVPPMALALHLTSANRFHGREENEAWQRLAQATDELNVVDLDAVLHTAVRRATALFSADEVEVELGPSDASPRLVRGNSTDVTFDGPPGEAPVATGGYAIPIGLESNGELRLRFRGTTVKLSERERYTLRTFAAALSTAVRNATTFAETQRLAESHARAAAQDPLTMLANRRRLQEYGAEVLSAVPSRGVVALLLIDLNHFKEVNDTLGHAAGDRLLIEVAHRLAASVDADDLVARLGGDEFAVLFVNLSAPAVAAVRAQALLAALAAPIDLEGMRISVEASGGVSAAPSSGGIGELLRRADVAMYQAKRNSQRVVIYADARDTADVGSLTLGGDLARAVAEREFTVNFQPIVDLGTGQAIAAEALTRWHHPDRGDLAPARFLDAVERSGQLAAFADAVLDQALEAASRWAEHGFHIPVAVNVSPRSLLDPQFPDSVARRLSAHHLDADVLMIELTESVTLSQLEVVDEVLGALRDFGVRLALDDFGTGYSSLATLARVPVDEIKIDRSFVSRIDETAPGAVVRSTIDLGRSLNLIVVAEGVEHEDQRKRLWELGCPAGQGHLFARALPPERLLAALERGGGALAPPLHEAGSVIRMPMGRRSRQARADGTA